MWLMSKNTNKKLETIYGGATISSSFVNAFTNIIKILMEAGHNFGSAIRRISEDRVCPLE